MDPKHQQSFRLGESVVHPREGLIEGPDRSTHVRPKVIEVLLCLARRPGEIVSREELSRCAWGEDEVSDKILTHCISELRHALGDSPHNPRCVQTVPKRGYRLVATVSAVDEQARAQFSRPFASTQSGFFAKHIADLRRRKVFQTIIGYPILAWLLVQIIDVLWAYLLQPLGAPVWLVPTFVVLLALGYPIAVFMTWAVDLTPEGLRRSTGKGGETSLGGLVVSGVAAIAITAGALFAYFNAYDPTPPVPPDRTEIDVTRTPLPKSIAVLRFLNISDNPAVDYLCDGLTEELIHELTNLKSLKVAARTSVWPFHDSKLQAQEIADKLGVEKVLEGSIRSEGNQIRVTTQLIDDAGFHLWSETYDRDMSNVLDIQKDIASKVVDELDVILSRDSQLRLASQPTSSSSSYDLYLQGRQFLRQPASNDSLSRAKSFFESSIELDNRFPLAYAGLCETDLAWYRLTRSTEYFTQAEAACHRALTLDGGLAEVYTALGNLYRHSGQYEKAYQEYQTALSINQTLEEANYGLGRVYQAQNKLEEAEETLLRSVVLEPGYWGTHLSMGNFLHRQGRYAESIPYYEMVTQLAPDYAGGFINLGSSYHWLGDWDAAETAWRRSIELEKDALGYQNLGTLYYYKHQYDDAVAMHQQAVQAAPEDHRNWGKLAAAQRYVPDLAIASKQSYQTAIALVEEQLAINPDEPDDLALLSSYLVNTGRLSDARAAIDRSLAIAPNNPSGHYFAAILEINSGNEEKALEELEKATGLGYSLRMLEADPQFAGIRNLPAFKNLLN